MVIVVLPTRQHLSGVSEAVKDFLVEAFIPQFSIEAFNEAVLLGLARSDLMPCDAGLVLPFQNGAAGQFCPVVGHDGIRLAVEPDTAIKLANYSRT